MPILESKVAKVEKEMTRKHSWRALKPQKSSKVFIKLPHAN